MKKRKTIKNNIKIVFYLLLSIVVFSLPYVSFYLTFFKNSSSEIAGFRLIEFQFGEISLLSIWSLTVMFITIISIGVTGIFWLTEYRKESKTNTILLLSLFISPILLFMVTTQPLRWLYFLPIPFLLSFSIYARNLYADVKSVKKITISIFILFMIAIIIQPIDRAGSHFSEAADFYQFAGKSEVEAFNWIMENTPPEAIIATSGHSNDVGGGGNSYAWWVEGYANRICMFTGDRDFYSFQFERDEVRATNRIFSGTYIVDYQDIEVGDSFSSIIPVIEPYQQI